MKEHPIVFVPEIVYVIFALVGVVVVLAASGVFPLLEELRDQPDEIIQEVLGKFLLEKFATVFTSLLLFGIVAFVVGSSLTAMKFSVIAAIMKRQKPTLSTLLAGRSLTWRVIAVRFLQFFYYLLSFVAALVVFLLLFTIHLRIALFLSLGVFFAGILVTVLLFFFLYPYMFLKNTRAYASIASSASFFLKNRMFVITVFLTSLLVSLGVTALSAILDRLTLMKISLLFSLLSYFVTMTYLPVFLFRVFSRVKQR